MTVTTTTNSVLYDGNGAVLVFPYSFKVINASDLLIEIDGNPVAPNDAVYPYQVNGVGNNGGGDVTFTLTPPPSGIANVLLNRQVPATQEVDYTPYDDFPAETHEGALDKLTMIAQQNSDAAARGLRLPIGDTANVVYPPVADRALKFAYFDVAGNVTVIEADPDPTSLRSINIAADSDTMMLVDYQTVSALDPLIGVKNINKPTGLIQLTTGGKLPDGLIDYVGLRTLGTFRGDDLCDKPGDSVGDCVAPDTRNPSERIPEILPAIQNGDYFILAFADPEISGTMNLFTNVGDAAPAVITVAPRDGILWLNEVADPNDPATIIIQAGWYYVPKLVEIGNAIDITYDDSANTYVNPAVNLQVAMDLVDAEFVNRDDYFITQKNVNRFALTIPGANPNNIASTGIYNGAFDDSNLPVPGDGFTVVHTQEDATRATQIAVNSDDDGMYFRRYTTTWEPWTELDTVASVDSKITALEDRLYPIGSYYIGPDPSGVINGTWVQIAEGTFLMNTVAGADPSGGTNSLALADANLPPHTHPITDNGHVHTGSWQTALIGSNSGTASRVNPLATNSGSATTGITVNANPTNVSQPIDNRPLFEGVEIWKRTA